MSILFVYISGTLQVKGGFRPTITTMPKQYSMASHEGDKVWRTMILTLYSIDTQFKASTTDSFSKHCGTVE